MAGVGRGRAATMPAWMSSAAVPPGPPVDEEVERNAMAAMLRDQDADMRAALASEQCAFFSHALAQCPHGNHAHADWHCLRSFRGRKRPFEESASPAEASVSHKVRADLPPPVNGHLEVCVLRTCVALRAWPLCPALNALLLQDKLLLMAAGARGARPVRASTSRFGSATPPFCLGAAGQAV